MPPREGTLIDLDADPNEQTDVSKLNPDVVRRLSELADKAIGEANRHVVDNPKRPDTKYYPGPGRITEHNAVPIHEALDRTRGE